MQELTRREPVGSLSAALGPSLQGLASGIASQIQQRRQRQNNAMGLQSLGIPEQQAQAISQMDEKSREMGVKNLLEQQHQGQLKQSLLGLEGIKPEWADYFSRAGHGELPSNMQLLSSLEDYNQQRQGGQPSQIAFEPPQMKLQRAALEERKQTHLTEAERKKQKDLDIKEENEAKRKFEEEKFEHKKELDKKILENKNAMFKLKGQMTAAQEAQLKARADKLEQEKEALENRKFEFSEIRNEKAEAATRDFRKDISDRAKLAHESDMRLGKMQRLAEEDKLVQPATYWAAKKAGLPTSMFANSDTEQFEELVTNFLRGARTMFGGRITNMELSTFLDSIPKLINSREGKLKIIKNLGIYNAIEEEYNNVMDDIIEKNNNKFPLNLRERVNKIMAPKLDKAFKAFIK